MEGEWKTANVEERTTVLMQMLQRQGAQLVQLVAMATTAAAERAPVSPQTLLGLREAATEALGAQPGNGNGNEGDVDQYNGKCNGNCQNDGENQGNAINSSNSTNESNINSNETSKNNNNSENNMNSNGSATATATAAEEE